MGGCPRGPGWGKGGSPWPCSSVCNPHRSLPHLPGGPASFVTYLFPDPDHSHQSICPELFSAVGRPWKSSGLICSASLQLLGTNLFVFGEKNLPLLSILYFLEFDMKAVVVLVMASKGINHLCNNNGKYGFQTGWLLSLGVYSMRIECVLNLGWLQGGCIYF